MRALRRDQFGIFGTAAFGLARGFDAGFAAAVDFVDDLEVARQYFLKERHGPRLKGFGQ
jgi:hypothetical protein